MNKNAFWVKDDVIINCDCHWEFLKENPKIFGMSDEYIKSIFDENNESLDIDDKSSNQLLIVAYRKGWTNLRLEVWGGRKKWSSFQTINSSYNIDNFIISMMTKKRVIKESDRLINIVIDKNNINQLMYRGTIKSYIEEFKLYL